MSRAPDLLRTIWTQPRTTMRWVREHGDGGLWAWLLGAALATVLVPIVLPAIFVVPQLGGPGPLGSFLAFAAILVVGSALVGLAAIVTFARMLAGRRPLRDVLRAVGWGLVPVASALPFAVVFIATSPSPLGTICQVIVAGSGLWGFVLLAFTLAEAHEVPTDRGIAILLSAGTLTLVLFCATLFWLMSTGPGAGT